MIAEWWAQLEGAVTRGKQQQGWLCLCLSEGHFHRQGSAVPVPSILVSSLSNSEVLQGNDKNHNSFPTASVA